MWLEGVESAECLQSVEGLLYDFVSLPSVHLVFSLLIKAFCNSYIYLDYCEMIWLKS